MRCSLHPLALVLAMASATGAQGLPKPGANPPRDTPSATAATAQLSGRVVAADTGKPLPRAIVQAAEPGAREPRWAWTDANGRWQISQVRAGRYDLTVSKTGYLTLRYGQLRAFEPGKVIEVTAGQRLERLDVALPRAGAISGRIHDEYGDPVAGVVARALRVQYVDGRPRLTPIGTGLEALLSSGFTDDIGRYRIHGLPPGAYVIQAAIGQPRIPPGEADDRTSYAPTYYPGTGSSADAQRITLGVGEDLPNIDLQLLPVRHVTLSGTAVSSSGRGSGRHDPPHDRAQDDGRSGRHVHRHQRAAGGVSPADLRPCTVGP
jgi:protocatechuate 3,4-dioxygenase beta subunit